MDVLSVYMSGYHMHAAPAEARRGCSSPQTGGTGGGQPPCGAGN